MPAAWVLHLECVWYGHLETWSAQIQPLSHTHTHTYTYMCTRTLTQTHTQSRWWVNTPHLSCLLIWAPSCEDICPCLSAVTSWYCHRVWISSFLCNTDHEVVASDVFLGVLWVYCRGRQRLQWVWSTYNFAFKTLQIIHQIFRLGKTNWNTAVMHSGKSVWISLPVKVTFNYCTTLDLHYILFLYDKTQLLPTLFRLITSYFACRFWTYLEN